MEGNNIMSPGDELKKVQESYIYQSIRHPKPAILSEIRQLRIVYSLDDKHYALKKRNLQYFVCGIVSPPIRRKDNFAYIDRFVIDIDNIDGKGLSVDEVKDRITKDERVLMCFVSPSEDGLKVTFRLEEKCYDQGIYTVFYKEFLRQFSMQYGLEQVVDPKTCDVTRACFISVDEDAYFNPEALPVKVGAFVNINDPTAFFDMVREQTRQADNGNAPLQEKHSPDPAEPVLEKIKAMLNPKMAKAAKSREVFVPEELKIIMSGLQCYIEDAGLVLDETVNIQYGKKLRMSLGLRQAEVNVFYGRRGFSVVVSPRSGTDKELNEVAANLIRAYIDDIT